MRILLIHQIFMTPAEAGNTRHYEFARYLAERGHQITVIAGTAHYMTDLDLNQGRGKFFIREEVGGVRIVRAYALSGAQKRSYARRLFSFASFMVSSIIGGLTSGPFDVVVAASPQIFTGISGYIVSRVKTIPLVVEIRDLWPDFAIAMGVLRNRMAIALARWLERWIYHRADFILINSPGFCDHLLNCAVPPNKITLIPNGADIESFRPAPRMNEVRKELGLGDRFVVLYAGAHGLANGLDTVLECAKLLRWERDIAFLLVGDGKEKPRLLRLKEEWGLSNVIFADAQPKARMPAFCAASDVGLVNLKGKTAFKTVYPNKLFDHMASGRPTILAVDGVARELLERAGGGVFVEPGNPEKLASAVLSFYHDKDRAEDCGRKARRYIVEHFDRRVMAAKLEDLLLRVTEQGRRT